MASAVASGCLPVAAPSLQLPKGRQVSGAANSCLLVQKSTLGDPCLKTSIQRRGPSPSRKAAAIGHHKIHLKVAAGAESNGNSEGEDSEKENSLRQSELKRRELLWAATGAFSYLSSAGLAQSAPVPAPELDINKCSLVNLLAKGKQENCCLPDASGLVPIQFKFEDHLPMRTRRPAHTIALDDQTYLRKYNEAYRLMKALPDSDPRSFMNQWHVHCAFCNGAYLEPGNVQNQKLQYHFSWTFLPWHRMYLYFHERILGELIGDPSFALPFWNWDNQRPVGANQMPRIFTDDSYWVPNDQLHNAIRNPKHLPPAYVDLAGINDGNLDNIIRGNLSIMEKSVVSATSAANFMGGPYTANQEENTNSPGSCETSAHNTIHEWVGSADTKRYPDNEDMGTFIYAGRDPLFYCHHANVDRLWTVWKDLPADQASTRSGTRRRQESQRKDFLDTEFAFYDHKKRLVHVKVRDSLDTLKLRYQYPSMPSDQDWINFKEKPSGEPKPDPEDLPPSKRSAPILAPDKSTSVLLLRRPPNEEETKYLPEEGLTPEDLEETLVIRGAQVPATTYMTYRVFLNRPDADINTPVGIFEFLGLITHIPHADMGAGNEDSSGYDFRLSIGTAARNLKLPVGESVSVTFVPINQKEPVFLAGLTTEWR